MTVSDLPDATAGMDTSSGGQVRSTAADQARQGRTASPGPGRPTARWMGQMLGLIWVVFLAEPLTGSLAADTLSLRVAGVVGVAGVALIFGMSIYALRLRVLPAHVVAAALAAQTAFVVLTTLAAHQHGFVGLVFVGVTAIFLIRSRAALLVVVVNVVLLVIVPRLVPGWQPEDSTAVSAALSGMAVFGFNQLVVRNRQLSAAQEEVAILAAAQERERLARDVHDVVGHSLTVVSVKAELAARLIRDDPDRAAAELADVQRLTRSALADVRGMVSGVRAVTLPGELAAARAAFDAAGIDAEVPGAVDAVPAARQALFAWVLREATTNVLRHSLARHVVVRFDAETVTVEDDGRGPGAATAGDGNGLRGLAERARAAGASFATDRGTLGGFRVAVTFAAQGSDRIGQ